MHKRQVDFFLRKDNAPDGHGHILVNPDKRGTTPGFFPSFAIEANHQFYYFLFAGNAALDMCHVIEVVCLNVVTKIHIIVEYHLSLRTIYNTYTLWQLLKR